MNQLTPLLEQSPDVFRYAWFGTYGGEGESGDWDGNGLNENIWTRFKGVGCEDRAWLSAFGNDAGWKIQTIKECLAKAEANGACIAPHSLSMDDDACYCKTITVCNKVTTWNAMTTWEEVADRDLSTLTTIGEIYETFGATSPTKSPTAIPTSAPTETSTMSPTATPSGAPTVTSTESPTKTPTSAPTDGTSICYDYSEILPLDLDKKCTGRSLFLEIRAKYLQTSREPRAERCVSGLSREIMEITQTDTTEKALDTFDLWCEDHMADWDTPWSRVGPPDACYEYPRVLELGHNKCTDRTLFLHIREQYLETARSGAPKCDGGLSRELMALTRSLDVDAAHEALQMMCANALREASDQADIIGWGKLEGEGSIDLEEFFQGAGFLNDETGNFQQEERDFLKRGGYEKFIYIGDDPRRNDHYPTTDESYSGGQAISSFYQNDLSESFLSSPTTSGFQEGSCQSSNTAVCCWHRDRQYFDKNGNCVQGDCANQNPGDNTDLCWIEDGDEVFPCPGDVTENDLH